MVNEVTTTKGNAVAFPTGSADPFAAFANSQGVIRGSFIKFDGNTGDFVSGSKDSEKDIPHGTLLACNMTTIKKGWICWKNSEVVEEIMVGIMDGLPPEKSELTDHGPYTKYPDGTEDGWSEQTSVEFRNTTTGELFVFKVTAKTQRSALGRLSDDYAKVWRQKGGAIPVVEFSANSFEPKLPKNPDGSPGKKIGKKWAPVFRIKSWMASDQFQVLLDLNGATPEDGSEDSSNYEEDADAAPGEGETVVGGARRARRI